MNNNTLSTRRIIIFVVAAMLALMALVGCATTESSEELNNELSNVSAAYAASQSEVISLNTKLDEANSIIEAKDFEITTLNSTMQLKASEDAKAIQLATAKATEAESKNKAYEATINELNAKIEKLEAMAKSPVEVVDGEIFVDLEYALSDMTVHFKDGTAALKATTKGIPVKVERTEVIGSKTEYRNPTTSLPRKDYSYAITYDGKTAYAVSTHGDNQAYNYANSGLFVGNKLETGYPLTETELRGLFGYTDDILETVIVAVEDSAAEYGYSFYVKAGNYAENPAIVPKCNHGNDCHCGNCEKCPALEPEIKVVTEVKTEVKTETIIEKVEICKVCNEKDCEGHCGKCGELVSKCKCQPKVVTEKVTEFVEVPVFVEVPGETVYKTVTEYVEVPGETKIEYVKEYIEVPGETKIEYIEVPGETKIEYIEVPGETKIEYVKEYIEVPGETKIEYIEVPVYIEVPGKPEHNPLEDEKNPNESGTNHNPLPEEENPNGSDFDDLDEILPDTTLQPDDPSNDEGGKNESDTTVQPDDSGKDEIIDDSEIIDTTLQPEDPSNDEGGKDESDTTVQPDDSEKDEIIDTTLIPEDSSNDERNSSHSSLGDVEDTTVKSSHSALD